MIENNNKKSWTEYFRLITPIFLFVLSLLAGQINNKITTIDEKLFNHLTNDEIHTPKNLVISKAEFNIYQEFRNKQICDLKDLLVENYREIKQNLFSINKLLLEKKK